MKKRLLSILAIGLFATTVVAQETPKQKAKKDANAVGNVVEKGAKATGEGIKDGAQWVGNGVEKGAKATGKGVKDAAKWTGKTAKKGAKAVEKGYKEVKQDLKKDKN